jgi:hypothetical protein
MPDVVLRETVRHWEAEASRAIETANGKIAGIKKSRENHGGASGKGQRDDGTP